MDNQSQPWESLGKMDLMILHLNNILNSQLPLPLPINLSQFSVAIAIDSFNPDQPFLSICGTVANVIGATALVFPIPPDGCLSLIPPVSNAPTLLSCDARLPSDGSTMRDEVPEHVLPLISVAPEADIEKEDLLEFDVIEPSTCQVEVMGTSGGLVTPDSRIEVEPSPT